MSHQLIQKLEEYKKNNSSSTIRSRGKDLELDLLATYSDRYEFSYRGSARRPYNTVIYTSPKVSSSCDCPYDYGGICKHIVAGINAVIRDLKPNAIHITNKEKIESYADIVKKEIQQNTLQNTKKNSYTKIFLKDHILPRLSPTNSSSGYRRFNISTFNIEAFKQNYIKVNTYSYHVETQTFTYNPKSQILITHCSCRDFKSRMCEHIAPAVDFIIRRYGKNVFSPAYFNKQVDAYLKKYGLTHKDDYEKYFEFTVNNDGLTVEKKVQNLAPSLDHLQEVLLPQIDEKTAIELDLNQAAPSTDVEYGVGYCLEFDSRVRMHHLLIPFHAKYKKHTKEFASKFKEISEYDMLSWLIKLNEEEQNFLTAAFKFIHLHDKLGRNIIPKEYQMAFVAFKEFITSIKGKQHIFYKKRQDTFTKRNLAQLEISDDTAQLIFQLKEDEDFKTLKPKIKINNRSYQLNSNMILFHSYGCIKDDILYLYPNPYTYLHIEKLRHQAEVNFLQADSEKLYEKVIAPLSKYFEIETKLYTISKETEEEQDLESHVYISDYESEWIVFQLGVQYEKQLIFMHTHEKLFDKKTKTIGKRNVAYENNFLTSFRELHSSFQEQNRNIFFLEPHQLIENEWLINATERMEQKGFKVFGAKELKSFKFNLHKPMMTTSINSNTDWFDVEIEIKYGRQKVSLKDVRKAILRKSRYVQLKDGTLGILPEKWVEKFSKYFKAGEVKSNAIQISNYQFNIIDDLLENLEQKPDFLIQLQKKRERLKNLKTNITAKKPRNVKATLRPYQLEGLNWLMFLHENQLGGCLADDMGLGKTLQTIAFFSYLKSKKKAKHPHLVIAPTSLVFNWKKEIEKFCPSLKTLVYTGVKRKNLLPDFPKHDIILSTYGSLLNDITFLQKEKFGYVVLDESQAIKNPNSKRYKAVRLLQSENRLALTGTPIENNTFDLYAQMNFLNPGLLNSMSHFKSEFSDAIDKLHDEESSQLLSQMIDPFILRRTKDQVATELPEKTESILYCEMGKEQRKVYETFKDKYREYLLNKIDENGVAKSQMYVLEGLTKLRQICNSPQLLNDKEDYGKASIKLDILINDIKSKTAKHKILVFSQFTSMLALVKERLEDENIEYEYLDGGTRNREEKVEHFQTNKELRVFLISLKAGGTGLNLTAADYVYLIDPWWNPAVESQAIDRCYRIGQTKHVIAYKMICKGTIEEKIVNLQDSKKQVSASVIKTDNVKKSFNVKQIKDLFA